MTDPGAGWQDHFSRTAGGYARYRPGYPPALFEWISGRARGHEVAWDCATGNGQAAAGLARHFRRVVATDASPEQLAGAAPGPGIEYRVARADDSGLAAGSVDVVTVAQALHWFDRPSFFAEAGRVLGPDGVLVCWMYNLLRVEPAVDAVVARLYSEILGPYWPGDRALVDGEYGSIVFPGAPIPVPAFEMRARWTLDHLKGYLRTWSAAVRFREARGTDSVDVLDRDLTAAWGEEPEREVRWPLVVRAVRIHG